MRLFLGSWFFGKIIVFTVPRMTLRQEIPLFEQATKPTHLSTFVATKHQKYQKQSFLSITVISPGDLKKDDQKNNVELLCETYFLTYQIPKPRIILVIQQHLNFYNRKFHHYLPRKCKH